MARTHASMLCGAALLVACCGSAGAAAPMLPDFAAAVFDAPLQIDNPYFPLVPGTTQTYHVEAFDPDTGETETETILVEVLADTRMVGGVEARVVRDRVFVGGLVHEDTFDWYAQDNDGNVWYLGEDTIDFRYDDDGNLIGTSRHGAWETGVDGALPGYIMEANPRIGDFYYQEYYVGKAEDAAEVVGLGEMLIIPLGTYTSVLRTRETSLNPDAYAHKFYAPGIGLIAEREYLSETGELIESVNLVPEPAGVLILAAGSALLLDRRRGHAARSAR